MTIIKLEINTCKDCPFFHSERIYTADSFERPFDWFCKKVTVGKDKNPKLIEGYVEWHEEKKIKVPEWCPIKIS